MPSYLLLESGSHLLLQDASGAILLESSGGTTTAAEDLLSALQIYFLGTSLPATITGGLYPSAVADSDVLPYATVEESSSFEELLTSTSTVHQVTLKWRVYAGDLDSAGRLADSLVAAFAGKGFVWSSVTGDAVASAMKIRTEPKHTRGTIRLKGGKDAWFQERDSYCRVRRLNP